MLVKSNVEIREVRTKAQRREFVDFPNKMYRDVPQFVPAFYGDDLADWDEKKNPAFAYCEARSFLAYRDGKAVGRIGAILSHRANEKWGTQRMRFTQVDFIDDHEVSAALFQAVEDWAKERGCTQVHGPLGFCDLDREGMLVEGFEHRNMFITYYNYPYYNDHMTALGYAKDTDWVELKVEVPDRASPVGERLHRVAQHILGRGKYHIADLSKRGDLKPYVVKAFNLVNAAYAPLYGVVELTQQQVDKYASKFLPLINPDYACMVLDEEDELVAFGACAPSVANAIKKSNGRLFPLGWMGVLRSLKHSDALDLLLIAVRPDLQGAGINAIILDHVLENARKNGIKYAETGPQLEDNTKILDQWKNFDKLRHKRRRCYVKDIV